MSTETNARDPRRGEEEREAALAALKRARRRAEEIAAATGTMLIQSADGKPVRVRPRKGGQSG
jgi:hypothetical protein